MRSAKVAVVIPCYNTSSACLDVIRKARTVTDAVLAVDDGSTDDTPQHLAASGARCIRLPHNSGKGIALRTGIEEVLKGRDGLLRETFDHIVTVDGDGQHDPDDIPRLIEGARREEADLVIGVRNVRLMPPRSKVGNYVSRMLFFLGTGRYVMDTQSGFRLITTRLAGALRDTVTWGRYETEAEILSKAVALGFTVATVEIPTIYFDQNRRTHFDPLWDSMRVVAVLSRYVLASLAVTAVDISAFVLALTYTGAGLVRANVMARAVAVVAHFLLSRSYAFKVQGRFRAIEVIRYGLTVLANLTLTTWLLVAFEPHMPNPVAAKIAAQLIGFAFSFVVLDKLVFRPAASGRTDWERYYRSPYPTAKWSRMIMARALADVILRFAPRRDRLTLLEIGGGNSCFLDGLMERFDFGEYRILDNSSEGMRLARERFAPAFGNRVQYVEADVFESSADLIGRFDVVLSVGLIEHFSDDEIVRLTRLHTEFAKPDGLIVIAVPTPTIFYRIVRGGAELLGIWQFPDERPIERRRLVSLMSAAGLEITSQHTFWSQLLTQALVTGKKRGGHQEHRGDDRSVLYAAHTPVIANRTDRQSRENKSHSRPTAIAQRTQRAPSPQRFISSCSLCSLWASWYSRRPFIVAATRLHLLISRCGEGANTQTR